MPSATPSAAEVCTQSPPPPPPPAVHTPLGSRSAREGHNRGSICRGACLLPAGSRRNRDRRVGEGSQPPMAPGALALFLGRTRSGACRDKSAGEADPHPTSCLSPGSVLCGQSGAHQGLEVTCGLAAPRCVEGAHNSQKPKAGAPLCSAAEAAVQEAIAGCTGWCLEVGRGWAWLAHWGFGLREI